MTIARLVSLLVDSALACRSRSMAISQTHDIGDYAPPAAERLPDGLKKPDL